MADQPTNEYLAVRLFGWTPPHTPLPGASARTFKPDDWFDESGWSTSPPNFDSSWDGAGAILEAMRARGYRWEMNNGVDHAAVVRFFKPPQSRFDYQRAADTLPKAVAEAARSALEAADLAQEVGE